MCKDFYIILNIETEHNEEPYDEISDLVKIMF